MYCYIFEVPMIKLIMNNRHLNCQFLLLFLQESFIPTNIVRRIKFDSMDATINRC